MSHFADTDELDGVLVAFITDFLAGEEGARVCEAARALGERARLVLRTIDPEAVVSVDFFGGSVSLTPHEDASIEIELEADALHDILLGRLDPVQISRLVETEQLVFSGAASDLAALVLIAGPLAPHYRACLERRGRQDLIDTPMPERGVVWTTGPDAPLKEIINERRSWQRPRRAASSL
jgi:hypothetical protein